MTDAGPPTRSGNLLLDAMSAQDRAALWPHLTEVEVAKGAILIKQGADVTQVHFPITADLSNSILFSDGRAAETTSIGRDGMSGLAAFLARAPIAWEVQVQTAGVVLLMPADRLRARVRESEGLLRLLLLETHDNQSQAAQTAACNSLHDIPQRLARWLLMISDRTGRQELVLTQQDLAAMLGAQRSTVNIVANQLRALGAIKYSRAHIQITDRARLEQAACECYRLQRRRSEGLALPTGG